MNTIAEFCSDYPILPYITSHTNAAWSITEANVNEIMYEAHSGNKYLSPLLQKIYDAESQSNSQLQVQHAIGLLFGDKWTRLREALNLDYGVIDNYNMEEEGTDVRTGSASGTSSASGSASGTRDADNSLAHVRDDTTIMTTTDTYTNLETATVNTVAAYNSSSYSPDNQSVETKNGTHAQTLQGADDYEDTTTIDEETSETTSSSASHNEDTSENVTHTLTRKGNIGVTTSQQMLESEIQLRNTYKFWDIVFTDLDSVLTLPIY